MIISQPIFPTTLHQDVSDIVVSFFANLSEVDSILLLNSCARGQATPKSDLDLAILLAPHISPSDNHHLQLSWHHFSLSNSTIASFVQSSPFSKVHLDFIDGHYSPAIWDDGGGPDDFELQIGNHLVHSLLLTPAGSYFSQLQATWLPYYAPDLRDQRLTMVRDACLYDLDFIPFYIGRSLPFQAFDRLYKAFREFMQMLFISCKQYPIAYNKWIYEQVVDILGVDDLYSELLSILTVESLQNTTLVNKAKDLHHLVNSWSNDY